MSFLFCFFKVTQAKVEPESSSTLPTKDDQRNGGVGVGGGMMDGVPALLQGLNGRQVASGAGVNDDEDGVFYDELISYPTQFRAPNHPPAYEVRQK